MHGPQRLTAQPLLTRTAFLALAAASVTMLLKFVAYWLTGSVGLLSDAVESTANLVAALSVLFALWFAARPVDRTHNYGHEKIEFFSSGIEGWLILIAAAGIVWTSVNRLINPRPLESIGAGVTVAIVASAINFGVALVLLRVARAHRSIVLEADGRHLLTDVLTSVGVVLGLTLAHFTGVEQLDPIIALLVAVNITWTGYQLVRISVDGLMDRALDSATEQAIQESIEREIGPRMTYHALRTRRAGSRSFVDFHLLVPGEQTVQKAHDLTNRIEHAVASVVPNAETTVHIEPIEEPAAWEDRPIVETTGEPALAERNGHDRTHPAA
jgi:cation diffusion facilitator family transporter